MGLEAHRNVLEKVSGVMHGQGGSDKVLEMCFSAVRRGGTVPILGVYGTPFDNFPLGQLFDKGITIKSGQAPVHKYIDKLLEHVVKGEVRLDDIISHRLPLADAAKGYDIFHKKEDNCTKVVLKP